MTTRLRRALWRVFGFRPGILDAAGQAERLEK
jgi:hypothetical protein